MSIKVFKMDDTGQPQPSGRPPLFKYGKVGLVILAVVVVGMFGGGGWDLYSHAHFKQVVNELFNPSHYPLYFFFSLFLAMLIFPQIYNRMNGYGWVESFPVNGDGWFVIGLFTLMAGIGGDPISHAISGPDTGLPGIVSYSHFVIMIGTVICLTTAFRRRLSKSLFTYITWKDVGLSFLLLGTAMVVAAEIHGINPAEALLQTRSGIIRMATQADAGVVMLILDTAEKVQQAISAFQGPGMWYMIFWSPFLLAFFLAIETRAVFGFKSGIANRFLWAFSFGLLATIFGSTVLLPTSLVIALLLAALLTVFPLFKLEKPANLIRLAALFPAVVIGGQIVGIYALGEEAWPMSAYLITLSIALLVGVLFGEYFMHLLASQEKESTRSWVATTVPALALVALMLFLFSSMGSNHTWLTLTGAKTLFSQNAQGETIIPLVTATENAKIANETVRPIMLFYFGLSLSIVLAFIVIQTTGKMIRGGWFLLFTILGLVPVIFGTTLMIGPMVLFGLVVEFVLMRLLPRLHSLDQKRELLIWGAVLPLVFTGICFAWISAQGEFPLPIYFTLGYPVHLALVGWALAYLTFYVIETYQQRHQPLVL